MEHISEILRRQTRTGTSKGNTDTWSGDAEKTGENVCPVCKGAGFVHPRLPSGEPDYSQVVTCSCSGKKPEDVYSRLLRYSSLGALARFTFANLEPQGRSGHPRSRRRFEAAYNAAREFAANPEGWLVLTGASGSGKTHMAAAIAGERIKQGHPALYISVPDLLDKLRSAYSPDSETSFDDSLDNVKNAPLLVLDDLGVQSGTPWAREKLDQLLNYRFNNEMATVIVTVTPVEDLEDRLRTRLTDPRLCTVYALEESLPLTEYSWGPEFELQKNQTFANFDRRDNLPAEQRENLDAALDIALSFAREPEGWLVFLGNTGCGKTHLAAAIVNYRYQAGEPALFVVVPEFLDHLRSTFSPDSKVSYDQLFESVKTAPLLVLDDFGEQSSTPWAREKLYQVLNYRYNGRLPTVITMRASFEHMASTLEEPVISRLADGRLSVPFNIIVPDYRSDVTHNHTGSAPKPRPARGRKQNYR